jgi:hypothetical protein
VLGLKRLPLPQDHRLSLMKSLMGTRQHPREGAGAAFGSAPDWSRRPKTTSVSSGAGGRLELDTPPVSPLASGVGAMSEACADPPAGTTSVAVTPPDADVATAGPLAEA